MCLDFGFEIMIKGYDNAQAEVLIHNCVYVLEHTCMFITITKNLCSRCGMIR